MKRYMTFFRFYIILIHRYQPPSTDRESQNPPVPQQHNQTSMRSQVHSQSPPTPPLQPIYKAPQQRQSSDNDEMGYQPPVVDRKPISHKTSNETNETKIQNSHPSQLYIPPSNQQQKRIVTPPSPPERSPNSPQLQTPPLREAPRPWQAKKTQQEELPPWTKKGNEALSENNQV